MDAFVIAMDCEAECVLRHLERREDRVVSGRRVATGLFCGRDTAVVAAGIGKANAAAATQLALSEFRAGRVFNIGVAGGLDPAMAVGDVFAVRDAVQYDFDLTQINGTPMGTLNERTSPFIPLALAPSWSLPLARLGSGDRFNDDEKDYALLRSMGAGLRDMEGAAMAQVCERAGVPLFSVKWVSDVHGRGSTPGQYAANLKACLEKATAEVRGLFVDV